MITRERAEVAKLGKIVAVSNGKGGVGKTSTAVALARWAMDEWGMRVHVVDSDPQGTAIELLAQSEETRGAPDVLQRLSYGHLFDRHIATQVPALRKSKDLIVIDVGGFVSQSMLAALAIADLALVPTQPKPADLWGTERVRDEIVKINAGRPTPLRALTFLTVAYSGRSPLNVAAAERLRELEGLEYIDTPIRNRTAWPKAQMEGRMVWEMRPTDRAAVAEFRALADAVRAAI